MPALVVCKRCAEITEPHLHGEHFYCDVCADYMQSQSTAEAILESRDPVARMMVEAAVSHYETITDQFNEFDWSK